MRFKFQYPVAFILLTSLTACAPAIVPTAEVLPPEIENLSADIPPGFTYADGSRPLTFPTDFGAHPEFRTEWWYYTGNLQTPDERPFGFELTIFRVGLLPPTTELPPDSQWYNHSLYFAHFAISDIAENNFHAFERYSRPGPGLAGAQGDPYRIWLEDWEIRESAPGVYRMTAEQDGISIDLTLTDEMGVILHGEDGYSRKGENLTNASYYYSQPRLRAEGLLELNGASHPVSGLAWNDHEFSTSVLDENQIGWDWFSLQFEDGSSLMLFQLRESNGGISDSSSGTFVHADNSITSLKNDDFVITVLGEWRSPHTGGVYPADWQIQLAEPDCLLEIHPWMADQEIHFTAFTYWEGAVHFEGACGGSPIRGNGYIELTGYAGNLPLP
ncbi:MAG TPA: lipocalin-like domain-containing protein [Anaerolineales bacterium]|nr:lipocalin-like domain-containing protein [Anaerolineales bacterium]